VRCCDSQFCRWSIVFEASKVRDTKSSPFRLGPFRSIQGLAGIEQVHNTTGVENPTFELADDLQSDRSVAVSRKVKPRQVQDRREPSSHPKYLLNKSHPLKFFLVVVTASSNTPVVLPSGKCHDGSHRSQLFMPTLDPPEFRPAKQGDGWGGWEERSVSKGGGGTSTPICFQLHMEAGSCPLCRPPMCASISKTLSGTPSAPYKINSVNLHMPLHP